MSKIRVHVLNFWGSICSHIEIVLQEDDKYYKIDRWSNPKEKFIKNDSECLDSLIKASEHQIMEIEANAEEIINAWRQEYQNNKSDICSNNCADAASWFLKNYTSFENTSRCKLPITVNYLCFCLFAPSPMQCCTLPGRIFDRTKNNIQNQTPNETSSSEMPEIQKMTYS